MSVAALKRSDEGVYTCSISGVDSPESWLAVKAVVVVLLACVSVPLGATKDFPCFKKTLKDCLVDKDYQELLNISENGLPHATIPGHVVIVGAGMAGLTAAKLLQDAGHQFVMYDGNTSYFVNGKLVKTEAAKKDPSLLGYGTNLSADELLDQSLKPEYLEQVANLTSEELRMIGDLLNENSLMYTALTEMIYDQADINDYTRYSEVVGGL
ncbi:hypothetical protein NHX12_013850 [Muraenolepis orangiensis]|uniref:Uncharacterized protein n=1 Tax=Muraenolepis orangiensis TaxID=630683 RepID=A0A9Q0DAQ8_9TELE|nr:hypothetical protein NHX12_013850 [Muraenolepis orangiensis]